MHMNEIKDWLKYVKLLLQIDVKKTTQVWTDTSWQDKQVVNKHVEKCPTLSFIK